MSTKPATAVGTACWVRGLGGALVKLDDVAVLTQELATLLKAGLPLLNRAWKS